MQDLTISLIQSPLAWENPIANLKHFDEVIPGLDGPSDLIILPEMFNTGFTMNAENNAEVMDGSSMQWMARKAAEMQCVICGSLIIHEEGDYYNRFIWMRPDGSHEHYDKKHLFRMGDEHLHFTEGNTRIIVELNGWKILPLICYDLRFPAWSKNEYQDDTYAFDLLIYVANWPALRSQAWTSLLKARAIENMAYAAGVNRIGKDGRDYEYNGKSILVAPDGHCIHEIQANKEAISSIRIKATPMLELRAKLGVGKDWDKFELL